MQIDFWTVLSAGVETFPGLWGTMFERNPWLAAVIALVVIVGVLAPAQQRRRRRR